ncbi:MAG: hypothetical protein QOK43_3191 [Acidimicrobiaceae bacterium]|nr:hypothetical protein [Acidimicrobiaceae bacterium]
MAEARGADESRVAEAGAPDELGGSAPAGGSSGGSAGGSSGGTSGRVRTVRNAALLLVTEVVGKLSTFVFTVVAARELTRADFGAFTYALAFSLLVTALPNWGFNPVVVRDGARSPDRLATYYSEALAWRTALVVPTFAIAAVVGLATRPDARASTALVLILVAAAFDLYSETAKAAAAVKGDLRGWAFGLIANRVVSTGAGIVLLALGHGLVGLCVGYLAGSALGAVFALSAVARLGVRPSWSLLSWPSWTRMGRQSVAIGVDALVAMTLSKIDTVILDAFKGDKAVALYGAAYRLLETVLFVTWTLNTVIFPRTSAAKESAEVRRLTEVALGAVASLFIPFGVVLALRGPDVLGLVFGSAYARPAATTVRLLSGAPLVFAIGFFASSALLSRGRNAMVLSASLVAAVVNIGGNLAVIPTWGAAGAAAMTTAAYAVEAVVLLAMCGRVVGWLRVDRPLTVPALAAVPLALAMARGPGGIVGQLALGTVLYAVAWLMLARRLVPEVVDLIQATVRRRTAPAPAPVPTTPPDFSTAPAAVEKREGG